ncbi:hypothetical protein J2Z19_004345 [Ensifer adhaerens]|uniref:Uncharacterized protein n=1 Tax=Ensifer adhaerens TaxID=106592 RepID=A0ACC5T1U9_ENSAD|nr:hypothetical protein [Ensifer adhaerens]MBP1874619.1 hypothetical protein [Ensifer adhaerens]
MDTKMHELWIRSRLFVPFRAALIRHLYTLIPVRRQDIPFLIRHVQFLQHGPAFFSTVQCRYGIARPRVRVTPLRKHILGSKPESDEGNAGDEQAHRCEGGEVTNKISHNMAPFPLCFYFVPFLFSRQSLLSGAPAFHRAWLITSAIVVRGD